MSTTNNPSEPYASLVSDMKQYQAKMEAMVGQFDNYWEEYLAKYEEYLKKRQEITETYQAQIAATTSEGEKLRLQEEMKKVTANLETETAPKLAEPLGKVFQGMGSKAAGDMRSVSRQGLKAIDFIEQGQWDEKQGARLGISEKTFDTLSADPAKLAGAKQQFDEIKKKADDTEGSFRQMGNGFEKVFTAKGDTKQLQEGIDLIDKGVKGATQTTQFLSDTFKGLGESFGSETLGAIAEGFGVVQQTMEGVSKGAKAGAMFGGVGAAAGAALGAVSALVSAIAAIHDKKNEKRIQALQGEIDKLGKSYKQMERDRAGLYSTEAGDKITEQNAALEQQKALINKQIAEEQNKKKTDDNRIKEWKEKIDEINDTIADNRIKMQDAIFGADVKTAIDNFATAYANAWSAGDDRVKASKDMVKNMIRQMVMEAMKAKIANPMQDIRNQLEKFWEDGVISEAEQAEIERQAARLNETLEGSFGWADRIFEKEEDPDRKGATQGIATASQESVDMLGGLMTSVQGHTYSINESVKTLTGNSTQILNHLAGIESNTGGSLARLGAIENSLASVKADLNNLVVKGITIR